MRVTFAQLETFFWIARLGSTQAAGRELNLAQPTISLRLRDLETALGVRLFDRVGRRLNLTHEGGEILERTGFVLDEMARIIEIGGHADTLRGVVRVGIPETFAIICLPSLMQLLQQEHPSLRLELVVATSADLEAQLLRHELDLAFMVDPATDPRLRLVPFGTQETSWLAAPVFGLNEPVRPQDLHNLPIVSNPHPSIMHRHITEWFHTAGLQPPPLNFCNSLSVIAHLVRQGVFVGFLPCKLVERELEAGAIRALPSLPPAPRAWIYGGYPLAASSPAILAILRAAREVVDRIDFLEPV